MKDVHLIWSGDSVSEELFNTKDRETVFYHTLAPLILRNYALRESGSLPDKWFWADELAYSWGFVVNDGVPQRR